jgi:hypothetical protein
MESMALEQAEQLGLVVNYSFIVGKVVTGLSSRTYFSYSLIK